MSSIANSHYDRHKNRPMEIHFKELPGILDSELGRNRRHSVAVSFLVKFDI